MLKLLHSDIMRIRKYLLETNYDFLYQRINGSLNYFINPWASYKEIIYNLRDYDESIQNQFKLLLLGERLELSEFGELDLEVVKSFINVGFLKCDNNYIWSEGYSIISYFNRFLVVSTLPDYKRDIVSQEIYMGIDSYRLIAALPNKIINSHLDLCTGSGIQAIMESHFVKNKSYGVDINKNAILVAKFNAILNEIDNKTQFIESDLFTCFGKDEKFDLITANPPFFPIPDNVPFPIQGNGGNDGLDIIRGIIKGIERHLTDNGVAIISAEGLGNANEPKVCDVLRKNLSNNFKCEVFLQTRKPAMFFIDRIYSLITNTLNYPKDSKKYKELFLELFNMYDADSYYLLLIKISKTKSKNKIQVIRNYSHWNDNVIPIIDGAVEIKKGSFDCLLSANRKNIGTIPNIIAECISECNGNKRIEEIVKSRCSEYEFTTVHNLFCEVLAKLEKIGMANYKK